MWRWILSLCFVFQLNAGILYNPYLQNVTENSITIKFIADDNEASYVKYGRTTGYGCQVSADYETLENIYIYEVNLTGLDGEYHYKVYSDDDSSADYTFFTIDDDNSFSFGVIGDPHHERSTNYVTAKLKGRNPDVVFSTGDWVENGDDLDDWADLFNDNTFMQEVTLFPCQGNHEWLDDLAYYRTMFDFPDNGDGNNYYYVDYENVRFIIVSQYMDYATTSNQMIWVDSLLDNSTQDFNIVLFHLPCYHSGSADKKDSTTETGIIPTLEGADNKPDLVFSGHAHIYERSLKDSINYVLSSGGGGTLRSINVTSNAYQVEAATGYHYVYCEVENKKLTMWVYDDSDNLLDSLVISKALPDYFVELDSVNVDFGGTDSIKVLQITNPFDSTTFWQITESCNWLSVSPDTGTLAGNDDENTTITISRTGQDSGWHYSDIEIKYNLPIKMRVIPEIVTQLPAIALSVDSLVFSDTLGNTGPDTLSFIVTNSGDSSLDFSLDESSNWFSTFGVSGTEPDTIEVLAYIDSLSSVGSHRDSIAIIDTVATNSPQYLLIAFNVADSANSAGGELGEFEAEGSSSLPNNGWTSTTNGGESCILAAVNAYTLNQSYRLDYTFNVPSGINTVYVFAEVDVNNSNGDDSFWAGMNSSNFIQWKNLNDILGDGWERAWVYNGATSETQHSFSVSTGSNTFNLCPRANGGYINWIVVTDDEDFDIDNFEF